MKKNKSSFKDDFYKHPVVFSVIFAGLLIVVLVVLIINFGPSPFWPSSSDLRKKRDALKKAQKELQKDLDLLHHKEMDIESFKNNNENFWIIQRDGDPKVNIQKTVNNAAAQHNFILSSVGTVRNERITDGVSLMGTTIRGEGSIQNLTSFLGEIERGKPKFYWQNFTIRPKSIKTPNDFTVIGTLQVVTVEDEKIAKQLLEKK